jgi:hypothetical protein
MKSLEVAEARRDVAQVAAREIRLLAEAPSFADFAAHADALDPTELRVATARACAPWLVDSKPLPIARPMLPTARPLVLNACSAERVAAPAPCAMASEPAVRS